MEGIVKEGSKISPVVKKETLRIGIISYVGIAVMILVFWFIHTFIPPKVWDVPFDYTVVLGGVCCGIINILNFLFMGISVQKVTELNSKAELAKAELKPAKTTEAKPSTETVASTESDADSTATQPAEKDAWDDDDEEIVKIDEETYKKARRIMSASFRWRMLMMIGWGIIALCVPCFNAITGLVPLIFPSIGIKFLGLAKKTYGEEAQQ